MITILFDVAFTALRLLFYALLLYVILANLIAFQVVDRRNALVRSLDDFLDAVTGPILNPLRRALPRFGNIDLSPLVALLLVQVVVTPLLARLQLAIVTGSASVLFL